jgi:hypothetical protein
MTILRLVVAHVMQQRVCRSAARRAIRAEALSCDEGGVIGPGARNCETAL